MPSTKRECRLAWLVAALGVAPSAGVLAQDIAPMPLTVAAEYHAVTADFEPPLPIASGWPEVLPEVASIDLTTPPEDLWERIRTGFAMPNLNSDQVTVQQAWYLNRPEYLRRVFERSRRYMFHIVEEIEKRGMPTELALLPMVESAYNPMALSPAKASGLWQFIPSTGRTYNLEQNWWVDERRDIVASTSAALDYLQAIYEMHGDWHLALASYNWGEGAVGRAIERNRANGLPTDYLSLNMPAETRNYVPKLQALKNIITQPQLFGLHLDPVPNRAYFKTVPQPKAMDVAVAARLAEMPVAEFVALNPAYNRPVMPKQPNPSIVLPADKVDTFFENLENHDAPLVSWQTYTVRRGERLDRLAARLRVPPALLGRANGLGPRARLAPGQALLVPARNVLSVKDDAPAQAAARGAGKSTVRLSAATNRTVGQKPSRTRGQKTGVRSKGAVARNAKTPSHRGVATIKAPVKSSTGSATLSKTNAGS